MSCRCAIYPGGQGRCNHCYSIDTERCLLSSFPFSSMMCQLSVVESKSATFPSEKARHLLDDSVLESRSPRRGLALTSSAVTNGLSLGKRLWPARDSRWPQPGVCSCLSVPVQCPVAPHPRRKAPCRSHRSLGGLCFLASGRHDMPWVHPHLAGGPEHSKQVEGAATCLRPAVVGWQLSKPGCCLTGAFVPGGATGPAGRTELGELPVDNSRWATRFSHVYLSSY